MALELRKLLAEAGEADCYDAVAPHWEDSLATLPSGPIEFLAPENLQRFRSMAGMEERLDGALLDAASRIASSPSLRALIWHCEQTSYDYEDVAWWSVGRWPSFERSLGEAAPLFYLIVGLAMVPRTVARHRELGVLAEITKQTITGPRSFLERYRDGNDGKPGIFRREVAWLRHNTSGQLFRVGRFEYMLRLFSDPCVAYRSTSGESLLLAADGTRFTALGWADARPSEGEPGWWEAHLVADGRTVRGFPISPYGRAEHREITLDLNRWKRIVEPQKSTILDVHIPVGGKMAPDAILASFRAAASFFTVQFPEKPFDAFRCDSWILGPQLEEIFEPEANLVRFLREVYLYPTPSSPYDGFFFVFSSDRLDERSLDSGGLARLPEHTTLQRKVKEYVAAGKPWRGGGMLFFTEDLDRFGSQCYRSRWPPASLTI